MNMNHVRMAFCPSLLFVLTSCWQNSTFITFVMVTQTNYSGTYCKNTISLTTWHDKWMTHTAQKAAIHQLTKYMSLTPGTRAEIIVSHLKTMWHDFSHTFHYLLRTKWQSHLGWHWVLFSFNLKHTQRTSFNNGSHNTRYISIYYGTWQTKSPHNIRTSMALIIWTSLITSAIFTQSAGTQQPYNTCLQQH